MTESNRLLILYGSQTGTAKEDNESSCTPKLIQQASLPSEKLVLMVVATVGAGVHPTNMQKSWKMLMRKSLPPTCLSRTSFAVIGLGDSSYHTFNFAAKKLSARLKNLGAIEINPKILSDASNPFGHSGILEAEMETLWPILGKQAGVTWTDTVPEDSPWSSVAPTCNVIGKEVLTADSAEKEVTAYDVECSLRPFQYSPGAVLNVYPSNSPAVVEKMVSYLNMAADSSVHISAKTSSQLPAPFRQSMSLETLLTSVLDLNRVPVKSFFKLLLQRTTDERTQERLKFFISEEGRSDLFMFCNREAKTHPEVLEDFPACRVTLTDLVNYIPIIKPRAYSICSDPENPVARIAVADVEFTTPDKRRRQGLCSSFLKSTKSFPATIAHGCLLFPSSPSPVICIGPGTGAAAFISAGLKRAKMTEGSDDAPDFALFVGHRKRDEDHLFKKQAELIEARPGSVVFTAFSRETQEKHYVQDLLIDHGDLVKGLLLRSARVYISGMSGDMPVAVKQSLATLLSQAKEISLEEALNEIAHKESEGSWMEETWKY